MTSFTDRARGAAQAGAGRSRVHRSAPHVPRPPWAPVQRMERPRSASAEEGPGPAPEPNRTGLPDRLKAGVEALSGLAMDDVRVHRNSPEPARLGALAYTKGADIHLGPGQDPHLPHEAWHVVQQKQGRVAATAQLRSVGLNDDDTLEAEADRMGIAAACRAQKTSSARGNETSGGHGSPVAGMASAVVQRRRIPDELELEKAFPERADLNQPARGGVARMLSRAWDELGYMDPSGAVAYGPTALVPNAVGTAAQASIQAAMPFTWSNEAQLNTLLQTANRATILWLARLLRNAHSRLTLGDPHGFKVRADSRAQLANLQTLLTAVSTRMNAILGGSRDADIIQIFGPDEVDTVKAKFAKAQASLQEIIDTHGAKGTGQGNKGRRGIFTDESEYVDEMGLAGEAFKSKGMLFRQSIIDNPTDPDSIVTAAHEALHSGNRNVVDKGYVGSAGFESLSVKDKLTNAAHFELIVRRELGLTDQYQTTAFTPPPRRTLRDILFPSPKPPIQVLADALRDASERLRAARGGGQLLHELLIKLHTNPKKWRRAHARAMPYWSDMEQLTIHLRLPDSDPGDAGFQKGVTLIDLALSEGLLHRLRTAHRGLPTAVPAFQAAATSFDPVAFAAASGNASQLRDLALRMVITRYSGELTGPIARDLRVIERLAESCSYKESDFIWNAGTLPFT